MRVSSFFVKLSLWYFTPHHHCSLNLPQDGGTLLRRGSRGIGMKRVTGDIWQYKQLYERIVSHYEATG